MAAMPGFQNITTFRTNNTGESLSAYNTDFFADRRGTGLSRYVNIELPKIPSLDNKRTLFNRSFLVSTNNLWKLGHGEFKANIDYSFNRVITDASNITTYFLDEGNRIVTENRDGTEHEHSLNGKFTYELNKRMCSSTIHCKQILTGTTSACTQPVRCPISSRPTCPITTSATGSKR